MGHVTSLSPNMTSWMLRAKRVLHGFERLAMQGVSIEDIKGVHPPQALPHVRGSQLAGDAFSLLHYTIVFKSVFAHFPTKGFQVAI